jgi:glycosyltransferase involved in cell wall biosynthesis
LTTPFTAAAGELVVDGKNGFILPLDADLWAQKASLLLKHDDLFQMFSDHARKSVEPFNFKTAAQGLISCFNYLENI